MPKIEPPTSVMVLQFRRRLVHIANILRELTKVAQVEREISLLVHDLIKNAEKQVCRAYLKLPDE